MKQNQLCVEFIVRFYFNEMSSDLHVQFIVMELVIA